MLAMPSLVLAEASERRAPIGNHFQSLSSYAGCLPCSPLPLRAINGERKKKKKKGYFGILTSLWPGERLNSHDSLAAERQHFVARILGNAEGSSEGVSLIFKGGSQAPV